MTKSTKILAGLGVVAALGTAALPLCSYAASTQSVSGNVEFQVEVKPAIAMTITGNDDIAPPLHDATTGVTYGSNGYAGYAPTSATKIDGYTVADYAVTSASFVSMLPNTVDTSTATSTIKVYTNDSDGYTLSVAAAGANLVKDASNTITPIGTADTIPSSTNLGWGFITTAGEDNAGSVKTDGTTDFSK